MLEQVRKNKLSLEGKGVSRGETIMRASLHLNAVKEENKEINAETMVPTAGNAIQ